MNARTQISNLYNDGEAHDEHHENDVAVGDNDKDGFDEFSGFAESVTLCDDVECDDRFCQVAECLDSIVL